MTLFLLCAKQSRRRVIQSVNPVTKVCTKVCTKILTLNNLKLIKGLSLEKKVCTVCTKKGMPIYGLSIITLVEKVMERQILLKLFINVVWPYFLVL